MSIPVEHAKQLLLANLNDEQKTALSCAMRRVLVIAGAGSGKTEVMARRVAWWVAVEGVPRNAIVAFTFTEAAAEELKFRIRKWMQNIAGAKENTTLDGMYIGTIHGFCLKALRDLDPSTYYDYEILDDIGRISLVERGYHHLLALPALEHALGKGHFDTISSFLYGWDMLNEYDRLEVELCHDPVPIDVAAERDWCRQAQLITHVGEGEAAQAFAASGARLYAYMRARRFLDFSTSQSELARLLRRKGEFVTQLRRSSTHLVVDEIQDINPVQAGLIEVLTGKHGHLTAVGDHRQAIYAFRGGRVDIMADFHKSFRAARNAAVVELPSNYRSTPRIIGTANFWAGTIGSVKGMPNPGMTHGRTGRTDDRAEHVSAIGFPNRSSEAEWIASAISGMVDAGGASGAAHDDGAQVRGINYSDIAVLVRSSRDVRVYQDALLAAHVPVIVRAGPDLLQQPEVLLFVGCLAAAAGLDQFMGRAIRERLSVALNLPPNAPASPSDVVIEACSVLRRRKMPIRKDAEQRLLLLARLIQYRCSNDGALPEPSTALRSRTAAEWVRRRAKPRRVFPQAVFHWFLEEAGVQAWDNTVGATVMFHLGQLSNLIKGIEQPGWTTPSDFKYQIIALVTWGASDARTAEAPLLTRPSAVTLTTIHAAKGLEFPAVFLADVVARRFPSQRARSQRSLPFDGDILGVIDPAQIADNGNYDGERRLFYVAVTRAERYLFVTHSGKASPFVAQVRGFITQMGGSLDISLKQLRGSIRQEAIRLRREERLVTSFSDLRYYLECPHDFYLRKVLGFTPTIDQAFGYGKAVHNLLRQIHDSPTQWAALADDNRALEAQVAELVSSGSFYLRCTTGEPLNNMRRTAAVGIVDYVRRYALELRTLAFEPEREFEALMGSEGVLISGTIDLVRLDDPPSVSIVDFKSGEKGDERASGLSDEMMRLQISLYGLAARQELEYEPRKGLVRYIGERDPSHKEMSVELSDEQLSAAQHTVSAASSSIKARRFDEGPTKLNPGRCVTCDFVAICGLCVKN